MKGDPLFEYIPPALQTVKLEEFQTESEEAEDAGTLPAAQIYRNPLGGTSLLLASTHLDMFHDADVHSIEDDVDRTDVDIPTQHGDADGTAKEEEEDQHPYYGAGRIKVAMNDPNSKERLPFTNTHGDANQYNTVQPSHRRTTIMPLAVNKVSGADEQEVSTETTVALGVTPKLEYQSPPRRPRPTTESPQGPPAGEESLLSFLQNWLQASGPTLEAPPSTNEKNVTQTITREDEDEQSVTELPPTTTAHVKVEKRNRVPSPINRPLKFPTEVEQSTKPPFTNVHELAHAVQPIVSAVPFVIVQGHSKVKTYGVNNLDTPVEKQTLGSKAVVKEKEHEKDAVAYKGESEEAETAFTTEPDDKEESGEWQDQGQQQAAVERPIAAGRPRPSHHQGVANGRPIDIRFPSGQGVKRPPLREFTVS
jgi:hypothetical protein